MVGVGYLDTTGLAVGLKKGFLVEKRKLAPRPASRKGVRVSILWNTCGLVNIPLGCLWLKNLNRTDFHLMQITAQLSNRVSTDYNQMLFAETRQAC